MSHLSLAARLSVAAFVMLGLAGPAAAVGSLPLKGSMEGRHVSRTMLEPLIFFDVFEFTGEATQLGKFDLVIETTADFRSRPVTGGGTMTFTAANGDRVVAHDTGSSKLLAPGLVLITEIGIIDPDLSTGRFAGATGKFISQRTADAATGVGGVTAGTFEGTIDLVVGQD